VQNVSHVRLALLADQLGIKDVAKQVCLPSMQRACFRMPCQIVARTLDHAQSDSM
jgi:hypothetical protein